MPYLDRDVGQVCFFFKVVIVLLSSCPFIKYIPFTLLMYGLLIEAVNGITIILGVQVVL